MLRTQDGSWTSIQGVLLVFREEIRTFEPEERYRSPVPRYAITAPAPSIRLRCPWLGACRGLVRGLPGPRHGSGPAPRLVREPLAQLTPPPPLAPLPRLIRPKREPAACPV